MDKGIFITWTFWRDKNTTLSEKAILIEISNLSMLEYGCVAHNSHFATLMGAKKEAISRLISSLEQKGYISVKIKEGSRNFSRTITINKLLFDHKQIVIAPLTNCLETKENKSINKTNSKEQSAKATIYDLYLDFDKDITDKGKEIVKKLIDYRKTIKHPIKTIEPIKAYLKSLRELLMKGYDLEEIISLQAEREWHTVKVEWIEKSLKPTRAISVEMKELSGNQKLSTVQINNLK